MNIGEIGATHFGPTRQTCSTGKQWWELSLCKERGTIAMTTRREHVNCGKCLDLLIERDKK